MKMQDCREQPLILAVDDNEDNLDLLKFQLTDILECRLLTALNGETALTLACEQCPDLIFLDIWLPDIDGTEVARRLKGCTKTASIPIVALTALARREDRDRVLKAGCNEYLSKPYDLDELEAIIARYLFQPSLP